MAIDAGSVYSDLILRMGNYEKNLQKAQNQMDNFSSRMQKTGDKVSKVGSKLTKTVTLPLLGMGAVAFKLASDMEESINKVDVAFKDNANGVKKWSETTLNSFGIAKGSALDMAALFGDMATSMDLPTREAAKMSTSLVGLAGDLASFKNIGIDQAQNALKGIFTGETESLKNLGIVMTQTNLDAFALAKGFNKTTKEMNEAEKVNLRYAYIMDKTKNAQGDFARTNEGAANQMRIFTESVKELGATFGEKLLPRITPVIKKTNELLVKFGELDDGTQDNIIKMAAFAAATGPALLGTGKLINGIGSITGVLGKLSPVAKTATSATNVMGTGIGGAGLAAKASTLLLNPWVLGIAAAGAGAVALGIHLSKDALPKIELFGEGISKSTEKAIKSYLDLDTKATQAMNQLSWSGQKITKESADTIGMIYRDMKDQVVNTLLEEKDESLKILQEMFVESSDLTEEDKIKMLETTNSAYEDRIKTVEQKEAQIQDIYTKASKEKRSITKAEHKEILKIQNEMKEDAIQTLSDSEAEQLAIMERLKQNVGKISAKQAAEVVHNSNEQKKKTIKNAEEEYNERLKYAAILRADGSKEATDLANKVASEAKKQYDVSVASAKNMHSDVVKEAKAQAGEHVSQVNWETGQLKSKWQVAVSDMRSNWGAMAVVSEDKFGRVNASIATTSTKINGYNGISLNSKTPKWNGPDYAIGKSVKEVKSWNNQKAYNKSATFTLNYKNTGIPLLVGRDPGRNARGTNHWRGGLTWVGEEGPELMDVPRGSKIYSNPKSESIVNQGSTVVNFNGSYSFSDRNDIDYFMNQAALLTKRRSG